MLSYRLPYFFCTQQLEMACRRKPRLTPWARSSETLLVLGGTSSASGIINLDTTKAMFDQRQIQLNNNLRHFKMSDNKKQQEDQIQTNKTDVNTTSAPASPRAGPMARDHPPWRRWWLWSLAAPVICKPHQPLKSPKNQTFNWSWTELFLEVLSFIVFFWLNWEKRWKNWGISFWLLWDAAQKMAKTKGSDWHFLSQAYLSHRWWPLSFASPCVANARCILFTVVLTCVDPSTKNPA